jgi:hypothetical protein
MVINHFNIEYEEFNQSLDLHFSPISSPRNEFRFTSERCLEHATQYCPPTFCFFFVITRSPIRPSNGTRAAKSPLIIKFR